MLARLRSVRLARRMIYAISSRKNWSFRRGEQWQGSTYALGADMLKVGFWWKGEEWLLSVLIVEF